jgi:collagenase-like PrtC family protease
MELLAPARDLDTFKAALDAGADAVYLGLKDFSARKRAPNFTFEDLFRANEYKKSIGRRLYVTVNTLVFEREIPALLDALAFLEAVGVDAIIVQDYGVYRIVRELGLGLEMHASTQMGTKNHRQARYLEGLGFRRVILERQLTLEEIAAIRAKTTVGLEVFIHGAMCFALSGCCFFSRLLTGRSGNRGECAQPCRWTFTDGRNRDAAPFSMRDLEGLTLLPELGRIGVDGLKIEGRMKGADYVAPVVGAYRRALDALALGRFDARDAGELLDELRRSTLSRAPARGFLVLPGKPADILDDRGQDTGLPVGKVASVLRRSFFLRARERFGVGDSLRVHDARRDRRTSVPVKAIYLGHEKVREARPGQLVGVPLPGPGISAGASVFLVHRRQAGRGGGFRFRPVSSFPSDHGARGAGLLPLYRDRFVAGRAAAGPEVHRVRFDEGQDVVDVEGRRFLFLAPDFFESRLSRIDELPAREADGVFLSHPSEIRSFGGWHSAGSFFLYAANLAAVDFLAGLGFSGLSICPDGDPEDTRGLLSRFPVWYEWENVPLWITRVRRAPGRFSLKTRRGLMVRTRGAWGMP